MKRKAPLKIKVWQNKPKSSQLLWRAIRSLKNNMRLKSKRNKCQDIKSKANIKSIFPQTQFHKIKSRSQNHRDTRKQLTLHTKIHHLTENLHQRKKILNRRKKINGCKLRNEQDHLHQNKVVRLRWKLKRSNLKSQNNDRHLIRASQNKRNRIKRQF